MLLETGQYGEITLIEHRIAVPVNIGGASSFLLFGSAVLRDRSTGKQERQNADEKHVLVHGNLLAVKAAVTGGAP